MKNVDENIKERDACKPKIQGHIWGMLDNEFSRLYAGHFGRILVADCLWMPEEHQSLARSIRHFLSVSVHACAYVIAGFHSGRDRMASFFEAVEEEQLKVDNICEIDVYGKLRLWEKDRGDENVLERKRWLAVALIRHSLTNKCRWQP